MDLAIVALVCLVAFRRQLWRVFEVVTAGGPLAIALAATLVIGSVAAQRFETGRALYPFVPWVMYVQPNPGTVAWEFIALRGNRAEQFPFLSVVANNTDRPFRQNFTVLAWSLTESKREEERVAARSRLTAYLSVLADVEHRTTGNDRITHVGILRCDMKGFQGNPRGSASCTRAATLELNGVARADR
jgi:hypothetical protein